MGLSLSVTIGELSAYRVFETLLYAFFFASATYLAYSSALLAFLNSAMACLMSGCPVIDESYRLVMPSVRLCASEVALFRRAGLSGSSRSLTPALRNATDWRAEM